MRIPIIPKTLSLRKASNASKDDREFCEFLTLLEENIRSNPGKLIALDSTLLVRLDSLIGGINVDINSSLLAGDD